MTDADFSDGRNNQRRSADASTDTLGTASGVDTDKPAVGVIVESKSGEDVARAILRAQQQNHPVLVTHYGTPDAEAIQFAEQLDAHVVHPEPAEPTEDYLRQTLVEVARSLSLPGLIVHSDLNTRVDYAASADALTDGDFIVEARSARKSSLSPVPEVLVGIPAYNEGDSIAAVVRSVREYTDDVVVVDDGSDDDTAAQAREAGATVVEHETNQGYGAALKTVFKTADRYDAQRLVIIDADGQHDPADIPTLVEQQDESGANIVIGSRFTEDATTDASLYRRFGLFVVNVCTNLSLGVARSQSWISDTQSGFRAYDRTAIESLANDDSIADRMSASTDILYHAHSEDYEVAEVGTEITYDVEDASSRHPVKHGVNLIMNLLRTVEHERPITVLGIPGLLAILVGVGFGYWTFANYIATDTFPIGLAVMTTFFGLAGGFASFTAIILHSLNTHLD